MDRHDIEKSKAINIVEIIEYLPNSIVSKTISKKLTGSISISSLDSGEGITEKISPFDIVIQIVDGSAEIIIDGKANLLDTGQLIVLPANISNIIKANERFKMIVTIIKSGYE